MFPAAQCAAPATYSSTAAWKMSVPTTLWARSGKMTSSVSPKKTPLPTEVRPDDEAAEDPDQDRGDPIAIRELPVRIARRATRLDEALRDEPDRAEEQRCAEHLPHHGLGLVAVALGQLHVEPHAEQ